MINYGYEAARLAELLAATRPLLIDDQMLYLAEEAGEAIKAFNRLTGRSRSIGTAQELFEELADVVITTFITADVLKFNLDQAIRDKITKIWVRETGYGPGWANS